MFDLKKYIKKMEEIRKRNLMTKSDLYKELGLTPTTLLRAIKMDSKYPSSIETLKKIKDFVDNYEKKLKSKKSSG